MQMALNGAEEVIDIHHAELQCDFLPLILQFKKPNGYFNGSSRMQERPIKI
jgi:hypothetical protein